MKGKKNSVARPARGRGVPALTDKEVAALNLAFEDYYDTEIAARLKVSYWTVRQRLGRAYRKLGVRTGRGALWACVRHLFKAQTYQELHLSGKPKAAETLAHDKNEFAQQRTKVERAANHRRARVHV